jgi:hypothetical protein
MDQRLEDRSAAATRWAPWWIYFATIVGANYLRKALLGEGNDPALRVAVALAVSAAVFVVVTLVHRAIQHPNRRSPDLRGQER